MIDVHAHITSRNFPSEKQPNGSSLSLQEMIDHAKAVNVKHIVAVSETLNDAADVLDIAEKFSDFIWPSVGLHPVQHADQERSVNMQDFEAFKPFLEHAINNDKICCVGEVGLDFSPRILSSIENLTEDEVKDLQRRIFKLQVEMAIAADLPVNVHSRCAGHHALAILYECHATKVIMHAFDGRTSYAKKAVEAGYFFSIAPIIVRSAQTEMLVKQVPLSNLLLESDAPSLGPERGVDNEPSNIVLAVREIARIKGVTEDEVIKQTSRNAQALFSTRKT
ncbi:putative deoxyribonuclease TATDN3-like protein [Dichotomocladium elegans]|nr:putative deoxyribonuclease TATDN3-like protein [Dichotomocladium elegans]